ncbi:MAG: flagellar motor protein MotB [Piscirickettsiaceae bacterium]|nr:MAG: flagellar motor protein MotB [Piscirickettsiaceae bacterium]
MDMKRRFTDGEQMELPVAEPDSWALSYVDLLLLMVTLFVLLLSYQHQELEKAKKAIKNEPVQVDYTPRVTLVDRVYINDLKGRVSVVESNNQVRLTMSDHILFLPGDAALSRTGERVLDELSVMLNNHPSKVLVEGHTDNEAIATPRFLSNWELSSARASSVTRHLIAMGISPNRLSAIGYADTRPVEKNNTVLGRAKNRRVELVLTAFE